MIMVFFCIFRLSIACFNRFPKTVLIWSFEKISINREKTQPLAPFIKGDFGDVPIFVRELHSHSPPYQRGIKGVANDTITFEILNANLLSDAIL